MAKTQRVLDPIHGLIVFRDQDETDQLAWRLVNCREFQRLRRIKQLGFSELVFPGATHTRFSHCVGVFHTARMLLQVIRRKIDKFDERRELVALCAALLHDLGHGPFSHTFENVEKQRGVKKRHEEWTAELICGDTEIRETLNKFDESLAGDVAKLLTQKEPTDIYADVVSSQFDADRLDYLRRDRYMTGAGSGGFDFDWLLDCLEVGKVTVGVIEENDLVEVDGLYLSYKGLQAAEDYLVARYHLYSQVYMHKTTRGAERMLCALLSKLANKIRQGELGKTGVADGHPLVKYFAADQPTLTDYSQLDDTVVWSSLTQMSEAPDESIARLAAGLRNRRLYKCFDVGLLMRSAGQSSLPRFRRRLQDDAGKLGIEFDSTLLTDDAKISAYGFFGFEDRGALQKVLIGDKDNPEKKEDISERSRIVEAIREERIYRVYTVDKKSLAKMHDLWNEVAK